MSEASRFGLMADSSTTGSQGRKAGLRFMQPPTPDPAIHLWGGRLKGPLRVGDPGRISLPRCGAPGRPGIGDDPNLSGQRLPRQSDEVSAPLPESLRVTGEVRDWKGTTPEGSKPPGDHLERLRRNLASRGNPRTESGSSI